MKKENSSNFFCSKFFMVMLFALGMTLFSNTNANAQQGTPLDSEIAAMTEQRDSFAPGTAKYDLSQDALDYLVVLDNSISSDPNYLNNFQDQFQSDPFKAVPLRKAHPSVVANYTAAQLAAFQNQVDGGVAAPISEKLQYILDANAY